MMESWADVAEPLMMPDHSTPLNHSDNIYVAFHRSIPGLQRTIPKLCAQLTFISLSTSAAGIASTDREAIASACDTADQNLDDSIPTGPISYPTFRMSGSSARFEKSTRQDKKQASSSTT